MFNAILWLARSGSDWEDMPSRFCKWRDDGTLGAVFHMLNADLETLSIYSTCRYRWK